MYRCPNYEIPKTAAVVYSKQKSVLQATSTRRKNLFTCNILTIVYVDTFSGIHKECYRHSLELCCTSTPQLLMLEMLSCTSQEQIHEFIADGV